jgi:UrcA family protein
MIARTAFSRLSRSKTVARAAALLLVYLAVPLAAMAQQPSSAVSQTSAAKASLAGLDLTTRQGLAAARNRLHESARASCSQAIDNREPSDRANFLSCIDGALKDELKQINSSARAAIVARGSAWPTATKVETIGQQREIAQGTSVMVVSISDLDVLSPQDVRIAQERVHNTARRICGQLTTSQDSASIYAKCVSDATAGALRQINETALATN